LVGRRGMRKLHFVGVHGSVLGVYFYEFIDTKTLPAFKNPCKYAVK
jgi:hypothetical protein